MKVVKIAVPDCYGTYDMENRHCFEDECSAATYCRDETSTNKSKEMKP